MGQSFEDVLAVFTHAEHGRALARAMAERDARAIDRLMERIFGPPVEV